MNDGSNGVAMLTEILMSVTKTMKTPEDPMFAPDERLAASLDLAAGLIWDHAEGHGQALRNIVDTFANDLRDRVAGHGVDDAYYGADRP